MMEQCSHETVDGKQKRYYLNDIKNISERHKRDSIQVCRCHQDW